jgi:hypothetical protein
MTEISPNTLLGTHESDAVFARRCDLVSAGREFPSVADLIRGCPFAFDSIHLDARMFGEAAINERGAGDVDNDHLVPALIALKNEPDVERFLVAANEFRAAAKRSSDGPASHSLNAARCDFYAAVAGRPGSISHVAATAVSIAYDNELPSYAIHGQIQGAVAWLMAATGKLSLPGQWTRRTAQDFVRQVDVPSSLGERMVKRMLVSRNTLVGTRRPANDNEESDKPRGTPQTEGTPQWRSAADRQPNGGGEPGLVVVRGVGNAQTPVGKRVAGEFDGIIGEVLQLAPVPDLELVRRTLIDEFPYADAAIDRILAPMAGCPHLRSAPILLVGESGTAKTSLSVRLAEMLGVPFQIVSCAGVSDAALAGTSRRWQGGEPSLPLAMIRSYRHASPLVILDDIDKLGAAKTNGSLSAALLGLLDPRTAQCSYDPYLQVPVDLSGVLWLATATTTADLPRPLSDRFRLVRLPEPGAEHIGPLAAHLLRSIATARGLDPQWALPLSRDELDALAAHWSGGSLRHLARLVEGVFAVRESRRVLQ